MEILIFFLLIFTLSLFFLYYRFFIVNIINRFEIKTIHYEDIRAGDIFLISFESISKMITDSLFKIQFIHPALVVEEDNKKYIIELMNYSNKTGFHKMELDEWISRQKHNSILLNKCSISVPSTDERSDGYEENIRKEISRKIISYTQTYADGDKKIDNVGGFDSTWTRYINPKGKYSSQDIKNDVTLCNEFCVYLLVKSGIVKDTKHVDYFHPDAFIGMKDFEVNEPFLYQEHYICDLSDYAR